MLKFIVPVWLSFFLLAPFALGYELSSPAQAAVSKVLDRLHQSASTADGTTYFSLFSSAGIFFGTDIKERWTVPEFKAYAMPLFKKGTGWTYTPEKRNIFLSVDKKTAWFDETLGNVKYGKCRGTGVLVLENGNWRIAQYHLTIPVPNEIAQDVVEWIRAKKKIKDK